MWGTMLGAKIQDRTKCPHSSILMELVELLLLFSC